MPDQPRKSFGFYNRAEFSEPKPRGPIFHILPPKPAVQQPPDKPLHGNTHMAFEPVSPDYWVKKRSERTRNGWLVAAEKRRLARASEDTSPLASTSPRNDSEPLTVARMRELVADNWRARQEARLRRRKVRDNWL